VYLILEIIFQGSLLLYLSLRRLVRNEQGEEVVCKASSKDARDIRWIGVLYFSVLNSADELTVIVCWGNLDDVSSAANESITCTGP
jgi:hypothetical protein